MAKKNEKRLCWSCDASIALQAQSCPYCGVELSTFSKAPIEEVQGEAREEVFAPPYSQTAVFTQSEELDKEEPIAQEDKNDLFALLLLLPGTVFLLFGIVLIFFAQNGSLTISWSQRFSYFYLFGSFPLLILGYRSLREKDKK